MHRTLKRVAVVLGAAFCVASGASAHTQYAQDGTVYADTSRVKAFRLVNDDAMDLEFTVWVEGLEGQPVRFRTDLTDNKIRLLSGSDVTYFVQIAPDEPLGTYRVCSQVSLKRDANGVMSEPKVATRICSKMEDK